MKWFKHFSDSHGNLKLLQVVHEFGLEAYAIYWICLELVAQQGKDWCINGSSSALHHVHWFICTMGAPNDLKLEKVQAVIFRLGEVGLIDANALKEGKLYIPKMAEYADTYTVRSLDKVCSKSSTSSSISTSTTFECIWNEYPNKVGKKEAYMHYKTSVKTEEDIKNIGLALKNYCASDIVKKDGGKYIMNGKTWFNNWQDWVVPPKAENFMDKYKKEKKNGY